MWLDDCRIPFVDGGWGKRHNQEYPEWKGGKSFTHGEQHLEQNDKGRFTPNLLVCDDMLNDGNITKAGEYKGEGSKSGGIWNNSTGKPAGVEYGDKGSNSRYYDLDLWFDKMLERL
jgi:hypothetical protein